MDVDRLLLLRDIRDTVPADHVTVELESARDSTVPCDESHLERLFRNVLDNAVRREDDCPHQNDNQRRAPGHRDQ